MVRSSHPSISIIIPTLNSERVLKQGLAAIYAQEYPKELVEIIIVDGGSSDHTLAITREFKKRYTFQLQVLDNPLKTGEAGKAIGARSAKNEILAFIDSDNILPRRDWLKKMVSPFGDKNIIASEPIEYTYRKGDSYINRYCALMGMNDPLSLFMGNYDRMCLVTNRWTGVPVEQEDRKTYLRVTLRCGSIPTIGANGFFIRRSKLESLCPGAYLFDVDILQEAVRQMGSIVIAKVKTGIIHLYCNDYGAFVRKQKRRVLDYLRYRGRERTLDTWTISRMRGVALFILSSLSVLPLFVQSFVGFSRQRDACWLFHTPSCLTTLGIYGWYSLKRLAGSRTDMSREDWSQ